MSDSYTYKLNVLPRGKDRTTPILNSCNKPYNQLVIDLDSNCFVCSCDGWLPISVGKVQEFKSLSDVWNSPIAQQIQQDVADKKYTWCAIEQCGIVRQNIKEHQYSIQINIDESCNLHCPSCRREPILHTNGSVYERKLADVNRIMSWLEVFDKPIRIVLSGNGDPLASSIIRPIIKHYKPKSNQTFKIFSNGLLLKKQMASSFILPYVTEFSISVDAGSKEVYENIRRPGNWESLLDNLEFLRGRSNVILNFVLQRDNFRDLLNFSNLCADYNFIGSITALENWGTWNEQHVATPDKWTIKNGTLLDHDILNTAHPLHKECMAMIKQVQGHKHLRMPPSMIND